MEKKRNTKHRRKLLHHGYWIRSVYSVLSHRSKLQKNLSRILRTHLFDKLYSNNLTCDLIHSNSPKNEMVEWEWEWEWEREREWDGEIKAAEKLENCAQKINNQRHKSKVSTIAKTTHQTNIEEVTTPLCVDWTLRTNEHAEIERQQANRVCRIRWEKNLIRNLEKHVFLIRALDLQRSVEIQNTVQKQLHNQKMSKCSGI